MIQGPEGPHRMVDEGQSCLTRVRGADCSGAHASPTEGPSTPPGGPTIQVVSLSGVSSSYLFSGSLRSWLALGSCLLREAKALRCGRRGRSAYLM